MALKPNGSAEKKDNSGHEDCAEQLASKARKNHRTWRQVAAEAANESDPNKLRDLTEELARLLDEREKESQATISEGSNLRVVARRPL